MNSTSNQSTNPPIIQSAKNLYKIKDDIIGDIIPLRIDAGMSVSTLFALETIFFLRLQLAQVSWDEEEPYYESLCRDRFEQIAAALSPKYATAETLNERIRILERLSAIGTLLQTSRLRSLHLDFALKEAEKLKETPTLTFAQKLRLDRILDIFPEEESQIMAYLLPQTQSAFEMAALAQISDFCTGEERSAILNRYFELYDAALQSENVEELTRLLTLAPYWNSDPTIRPLLSDAPNRTSSIKEFSLPVRRLNPIAAEIYRRIDSITGNFNILSA